MNRYLRYSIPLVLFLLLAALLGWGLQGDYDPRHIPSPLIGKSIPAFSLPALEQPGKTITDKDLLGKVYLLNVWATWCATCRAEHETLVQLARSGKLEIIGLNWKDDREKAKIWLQRLGNPYTFNIFDEKGRTAIDLGVYGAPESFLVDSQGIIRFKESGMVTHELFKSKIQPILEQLKNKG